MGLGWWSYQVILMLTECSLTWMFFHKLRIAEARVMH